MGVANTSHVCICVPGYTSKDCSTDIDECASTPCKHKGTCTDELNSFSCNCTKGFFGETCEDDIDECASMPCMNNGTCLNQIGKYECDCPLHYTGKRCETDLCNPNPCQHGGLCDYSNSTNDYHCECIEIYGGKSCEKKVDNCLSDPCANGGVCIPGVAWKCQCKSGWEGNTCADDIDECASNPCNNLGNCTDHFNGFTCTCLPAFSGLLCEEHLTTCVIQTDEEKSQRVAMMTAQSLSSIGLIVCLCIVLVIFILLLQHSTERILHMGEEISLLLAHIIILIARTPTIADAAAFCDGQASGNPVKLGEDQCRMVATILHYLFMVHFGFFFLEALNNYCVNTYIANGTSMYGRWKNLLLGLGVPLIPVAATAIFHFKTYINDHTCWCNVDEPNFIGEVVPALLFCVPALVLNEAAGMGHYNEHPDSVKEKRHSAYGSSRGAIFIIPLSLITWIVGMTAVHETNLSLYSLCSVLNLILGIAILIAHTLGNSRARNLLHKVLCWWSCEKKNVDPALPAANPSLLAANPSTDNNVPPNINDRAAVQNGSGSAKQNDDIDLDKMIRDAIAPLSGSGTNVIRRNPKNINRTNEDIDLDKMIRDSVSRI
uniref:Uncharacterized protein n=1 Tax=Plectus sambesii TaxID=2011161 RepID=A0A914WFQ8_9BILA